jgi:hypothetical protein
VPSLPSRRRGCPGTSAHRWHMCHLCAFSPGKPTTAGPTSCRFCANPPRGRGSMACAAGHQRGAAPHPGPHRPKVPTWSHRCRHADTAEGAGEPVPHGQAPCASPPAPPSSRVSRRLWTAAGARLARPAGPLGALWPHPLRHRQAHRHVLHQALGALARPSAVHAAVREASCATVPSCAAARAGKCRGKSQKSR